MNGAYLALSELIRISKNEPTQGADLIFVHGLGGDALVS